MDTHEQRIIDRKMCIRDRALALLKPHEEYFEDDYYWNFRMGYSYFYLDQEGRALRYFEKALEVRPGDDDTKEFIDRCKQGISLPQFWECFQCLFKISQSPALLIQIKVCLLYTSRCV